jgi:GntR family transcriptional regulator, transcriptional repressor for pyruvate dehydrogenase complex
MVQEYTYMIGWVKTQTCLPQPRIGDQLAEGVIFTRVAPAPRLSDMIADRLLEAIISGRLEEGDRLPSERELGEQFGVSRTVIREAVRSLATKGVVEVRSGRGVRVARLNFESVTEAMSLLLRGSSDLDFSKVHEVRAMLEAQIAAAAAERATDEEVAELEELTDQLVVAGEEIEAASQLDVEFHRALARSTQNELYLVLLDSIGAVLLEIRRTTLSAPHRSADVVAEHESIVNSIKLHDPVQAREMMDAHLQAVERAWRGRMAE